MKDKEYEDWKAEIEKERLRKRKKKAVTLYVSEEYVKFLKEKEVNISQFVDDSMMRFVFFIKREIEKEKKNKEGIENAKEKEN